jgi:hypothetical protein
MLSSLIGIIASSGGAPASLNSYESIATVTVGGGGSATVTFSSIPSTYTHLQIRGIGRTNRASTRDQIAVRFNSDSGANYSTHELNGDGSTATALATTSYTSIEYGFGVGAASATSGIFGGGVIDVLDYANTNKNTTMRSLGGVDTNGAGKVMLGSGAWYNTAAVTSVTILSSTGSSFVQYSSFALYGIKG